MVRLGLGVLVAVLTAKALAYWIGFSQLAERALGDAPALGAPFLVAVARHLAIEGGILIAGGLIVAHLLGVLGFTASPRRLFAILLIASAPLLLYTAALIVALAGEWQLNAWVMQMPGATPDATAATLLEAMPVLFPWPAAAWLAVAMCGVLAVALQMRLCGASFTRALPAAVTFAAVLAWMA